MIETTTTRCLCCGETMQAARSTKRFCGATCRQRYHRGQTAPATATTTPANALLQAMATLRGTDQSGGYGWDGTMARRVGSLLDDLGVSADPADPEPEPGDDPEQAAAWARELRQAEATICAVFGGEDYCRAALRWYSTYRESQRDLRRKVRLPDPPKAPIPQP